MPEVLTYNIQFAKNPQMFPWIGRLPSRPEVLLLQESPDPNYSIVGPKLNKLGYQYVFAPSVVYGSEKKANYQEFGQVTAVSKDYKILGDQTVHLGVNGAEQVLFNAVGAQGERSALNTWIETAEGEKLSIANIHLLLVGSTNKRLNHLDAVIARFGENEKVLAGWGYKFF